MPLEGEQHRFIGIPNLPRNCFGGCGLKIRCVPNNWRKVSSSWLKGRNPSLQATEKNELVVGAVGVLQFDLVAFRLRDEYRAECIWENSPPIPLVGCAVTMRKC